MSLHFICSVLLSILSLVRNVRSGGPSTWMHPFHSPPNLFSLPKSERPMQIQSIFTLRERARHRPPRPKAAKDGAIGRGRSSERVSKELEVIAHDDLRLRTKGPFSPFSFLPFSEVLILTSFCRETPSKKSSLVPLSLLRSGSGTRG